MPIPIKNPIFGFAEFIAAFSLLMVLYTITDTRYKFRISIAPTSFEKISLLTETFLLTLLIAVGTLLSDVWFEKGWMMPSFLSVQAYWQSSFATFFVILLSSWIRYAFIIPPVFSKKNYTRFIQELYREIVKGSAVDLPIIANELNRSAPNIVKYSNIVIPSWQKKDEKNRNTKNKFDIGQCAYEILLLIGNRKLCKYIVSNTPITAIAFFEEMTRNRKYQLPIGTFATNIAAEALLDKDSILYHEDEGYNSGLIGYIKPFSKAVFGNCKLVSSLSHQTPFDIDYKTLSSLDASQLKVYTKSFLIFVKDCLENSTIDTHQTTFNRTLGFITGRCTDIYKINNVSDFYNTDAYRRLEVVSDFIKDLVKLLKEKDGSAIRRKLKSSGHFNDYYDVLVESMFDVLSNVASVKAPFDTSWQVQHNTVWNNYFSFVDQRNHAQKIIHSRLCRRIYSEIKRMEEFPNYLSIKILGLCLNVMGLQMESKTIMPDYRAVKALHKCILGWTQKNYLRIREKNIDVAESGLMEAMSFDENGKRLVKTYPKFLDTEATKHYLNLHQ